MQPNFNFKKLASYIVVLSRLAVLIAFGNKIENKRFLKDFQKILKDQMTSVNAHQFFINPIIYKFDEINIT